jgi:hypothetical protein
MILEIKVNDNYQKELLTILENLKGVMIDGIAKKEGNDDFSFLTKEIEKGLASGVSDAKSAEIFKRLKSKYA